MNMKGYLMLQNGEHFTGKWYGEAKECIGELIFFTGMGHFQEFITDPANKGKIVVATFPAILNRPIDTKRFESDEIQIAGLITQYEYPDDDSFPQHSFMHSLIDQGIAILTGMDTRAIIKRLKLLGEKPALMTTMNRSANINELLKEKERPHVVGKKEKLTEGNKHVVIVNFGYKKTLIQPFLEARLKVTIVPAHLSVHDVHTLAPDGVIFSGGPGNPEDWKSYFQIFKEIAVTYPTIGVGLGHQILAMSFGASIEKMKIGHRSFKEPIVYLATNQIFMSTQNHGFTINEASLHRSGFLVSFKNIQDQTIEGLVHERYNIKTCQFHPECENNQLNDLIFKPFIQEVNDSKGAAVYA